MNRLDKMSTSDILIKHIKLKNRMDNLAVNYTDDHEGWILLNDYNELMTSIKITMDVLQAELKTRDSMGVLNDD